MVIALQATAVSENAALLVAHVVGDKLELTVPFALACRLPG